MASTTPSRLALCLCGLSFALAARAMRAMPLQLGLCPCDLALPLGLMLCARSLGCSGGGGGGGGSSGSNGGKCLPSRLPLCTRRLGPHPCGSASPASPLQLALRPRGMAFPKHNNQIAKQWPQKLLWQRCCLSAAAVAAGSSSAGSCGGIGCSSVIGSISISFSGNGGGGGGGSSGRRGQWRWKWRR